MPLIVLFLILVEVTNANYREEYCENSIYIPQGNRYPHLHCGKKFFTLSVTSDIKEVFIGTRGVNCGKVKKVLDDPWRYYKNKGEIEKVLQRFYHKECLDEL